MPFLTSDLLSNIPWIKHGFFTREKGTSEGIYKGRNCGPGSNDALDHVKKNRLLVLEELNQLPFTPLLSCYQIHSNKVISVEQSWDVYDRSNCPQADAMVTAKKEMFLGILTADCVPILFADTTKPIIAATHAGWRGASTGVIKNTVNEMIKQGAEISNIVAAIGPCISQKSYEVGTEFYDNILSLNTKYKSCFTSINDSHHFDLKDFVTLKLAEAGIINTDIQHVDTYEDEARFYSFRKATHKAEKDYGRFISVIGIE